LAIQKTDWESIRGGSGNRVWDTYVMCQCPEVSRVAWKGGRVGDPSALVRCVSPGSEDGVELKSRTKSEAKGTWKRVGRRKRAEEVEGRCGMWSAARSMLSM
jgi:hypothetical protein